MTPPAPSRDRCRAASCRSGFFLEPRRLEEDHRRATGSFTHAFTLLELLVVVAILAIVGTAVITVYDGVEDRARTRIGRAELAEIGKAIRRFRVDTGYAPKQGPFALAADGGRIDATNDAHWPAAAPDDAAARRAWFRSPANLYQLTDTRSPLANTGHVLAEYSPDAARGWRGPYIGKRGNGFVTIGDDLARDGTGSPTAGQPIENVPAVAGPHRHEPTPHYLRWRSQPNGAGRALNPWGRPFLVFDRLADPRLIRIVGFGEDGVYNTQDDASLELAVQP